MFFFAIVVRVCRPKVLPLNDFNPLGVGGVRRGSARPAPAEVALPRGYSLPATARPRPPAGGGLPLRGGQWLAGSGRGAGRPGWRARHNRAFTIAADSSIYYIGSTIDGRGDDPRNTLRGRAQRVFTNVT